MSHHTFHIYQGMKLGIKCKYPFPFNFLWLKRLKAFVYMAYWLRNRADLFQTLFNKKALQEPNHLLLVLYIQQNVFDVITLLKTSRPKLICLKPKAFIFHLVSVAARYQHAKKVPNQKISLFINRKEILNTQIQK